MVLTRRTMVAALMAAPTVHPLRAHTPHLYEVAIRSFEYAPSVLRVKPADIIRWTNHDIAPHTATADDDSWSSPALDQGESWEWQVPDGPFTAAYYCVFHPMMRARLQLAPA